MQGLTSARLHSLWEEALPFPRNLEPEGGFYVIGDAAHARYVYV